MEQVMDPRIKAIETEYKGYRFRSRIEARWAVFFDRMHIAYEYEKEGYNLTGIGCYLPDFWLPEWRVHLEVKGQSATEEEKAKCRALRDATGRPVLLVSGPIENSDKWIFCWDVGSNSAGSSEHWFNFGVTYDGKPFYCAFGDSNHELFADEMFSERIAPYQTAILDGAGHVVAYQICLNEDRVEYEIDYAKSARFEHGEKP